MPVGDSEIGLVHTVLWMFANLGEQGRNRFICEMNKFLLASPKHRKILVIQWAKQRPELSQDRQVSDAGDDKNLGTLEKRFPLASNRA